MRWSELSEKQCVDLKDGERLGDFCDLDIDPYTGAIQSIYTSVKQSWLKKKGHKHKTYWFMVQKVGPEMVIVNSERRRETVKSYK